MPSLRRIGAPDSRTREALLDAAQHLLLQEGYAAVTSRRVASRAGLKPQLVHYYFRTMDDLYVELFRRQADRGLARFEEATAGGGSLMDIWRHNQEPPGAAWTIEFVALANHRKAIRAEIARYAERFRRIQLDVVTRILAEHGIPADETPPMMVLMMMMGVSQVMALEDILGVTSGHADATAYVERYIAQLEHRRRDVAGPRRRRAGG